MIIAAKLLDNMRPNAASSAAKDIEVDSWYYHYNAFNTTSTFNTATDEDIPNEYQ